MEAQVNLMKKSNSARRSSIRPKSSLAHNLRLVMTVRDLSPTYVQQSSGLAPGQIQKWTDGTRSGIHAWDDKVESVARWLSNTGPEVTMEWLCYNEGYPPSDVSEYLKKHPNDQEPAITRVSEVMPKGGDWDKDVIAKAREMAPNEPDWAWQLGLEVCPGGAAKASAAFLADIVRAIARNWTPNSR